MEEKQQRVGEIAAVGSVQILAALTASIPAIGGIGAVMLNAWQMEQQRKFAEQVELRFRDIDQTKLDQHALESDWFKELLIRTVEEASKTASELKRQALASVLVNSVVTPSSQTFDKMALFRVLSQLSGEEIATLTAIQEVLTQNPLRTCKIEFVAKSSGLSYKNTKLTCEGLAQLKLLEIYENGDLNINEIGRRLIAWWSGEELLENFQSFRKTLEEDVKQQTLNTLHDVFRQAQQHHRY